jgi:hypothetical protein
VYQRKWYLKKFPKITRKQAGKTTADKETHMEKLNSRL